jgi:hypothetical protein
MMEGPINKKLDMKFRNPLILIYSEYELNRIGPSDRENVLPPISTVYKLLWRKV